MSSFDSKSLYTNPDLDGGALGDEKKVEFLKKSETDVEIYSLLVVKSSPYSNIY